ncbi:MAG: SWIM zinc finger family protein [Thermofilum sp.]|jgi:predicted nucleic acid-binding Zn finger protein|nr:SWIM zinc finger family protein [Thermofilum sp.]
MSAKNMRENRAIKAVLEKRVKCVKVKIGTSEIKFFIVESSNKEKMYVVLPGLYCSCPDFLFSVRFREQGEKCYHMMAVEIAVKEKRYVEIEIDKENLLDRIIYTFLGRLETLSKAR